MPAMPPTSTWPTATHRSSSPATPSPTPHGATDTATLTITVTGTNDAPVAVADINAGDRGRRIITGSVASNDSDVDDGDTATLSYALDAPVAGLTLNANGTYSFDAANAAYQHLADGDATDVVASYTVTDAHGATDTATLTITVTGTNDAPVAVADTDAGHRRRPPSPARSPATTAMSTTATPRR